MEDLAQQQAALNGDGSVRSGPAATGRLICAKPEVNGGLIKPEGEASSFGEG